MSAHCNQTVVNPDFPGGSAGVFNGKTTLKVRICGQEHHPSILALQFLFNRLPQRVEHAAVEIAREYTFLAFHSRA